jgi:hypothetical protein
VIVLRDSLPDVLDWGEVRNCPVVMTCYRVVGLGVGWGGGPTAVAAISFLAAMEGKAGGLP